MSKNTLKSRIIHTHDTAANWSRAITFIPKNGELIVYDPDIVNTSPRFKLGDGVTPVNDLPFAIDDTLDKFFNKEGDVIYADGGRITEYRVEE